MDSSSLPPQYSFPNSPQFVPPPKRPRTFFYIIFSLVFLMVLVLEAYITNQYIISRQASNSISTTPSASITPSSLDSSQSRTNNPMTVFSNKLSNNNYKITTTGKISYSTNNSGTHLSNNIDYNNSTFYLNKGTLIKAIYADPEKPITMVPDKEKLYYISDSQKTYSAYTNTDEDGQFFFRVFSGSFPLRTLLEDTQNGKLTWQTLPDSFWQTNWKWPDPIFATENMPIIVRIKLDPNGLIPLMSVRSTADEPWQDVTFTYSSITTIDSSVLPPPGYSLSE